MAKTIIVIGIILVIIGLLLSWQPNLLAWFGKLPGDIRIARGSFSLFIPITSMIVISLALTLGLNLLFRR